MKRNELILAGAVFLLALLLRFYDFTYPDFLWGDEKAHVPAATNYWLNGQFEPDNWEHPPLRHIIEYGFLQIFGDNPYGWRMRNVLFGALAAALTCVFAHHVTNSRKTALLAGLFLATDPLHIVLSRYTFEEVYGGAFFLMAVILYMKHSQRSFMFILSAVFMGCALATKWYYAPCWLMICYLALREKQTYRQGGAAVFVATTYLLIPASIFIISYYNWFGRGYSFTEFNEFIINAYYSLQKYRPNNYHSGMIFLSHPSSLEWFTRPVMVGQGTYIGQNSGEFIMYVNSLPIWILTLPSMAGLGMLAWKRRSISLAYPVLFFCVTYSLYLVVKRPAFLYSATILLPFSFTAIAFALSQIADRYGRKLFYAVAAVLLAWNMYLYPLVTAKKVPVAAYRLILKHANLQTH